MAVIRNQDNFTDPLQYIRDQLFILDYNNSDHDREKILKELNSIKSLLGSDITLY